MKEASLIKFITEKIMNELPESEFDPDLMACLLLRIWSGFKKCNMSLDNYMRESKSNAMYEAKERIELYCDSKEINHLMDGIRYLIGEFFYQVQTQGTTCLPQCYQNFLNNYTVHI